VINIAVCDDDLAVTGIIENHLMQLEKTKLQKLNVEIFFSGEEFCNHLNESGETFDIILMDIEMGGITGIEAGRRLRENIENNQTLLIYVSSHESYYGELINLDVFRFISKPVKSTEFNHKVSAAITKVMQQRQAIPIPDLVIMQKGKKIHIPIRAIMYLESDVRRIHLHCTTGVYTYYGKLSEEEKKLPKEIFCRIHNSYLVCFTHVKSISVAAVVMPGVEFPISHKYREAVKMAYGQFRGVGRE